MKKTYKLNAPIAGREAGKNVTIQVDENGKPISKFWRRRIKDMAIDNCMEEVKNCKPVSTRNTTE